MEASALKALGIDELRIVKPRKQRANQIYKIDKIDKIEHVPRRYQPDRTKKNTIFDYSEADYQLNKCEKMLKHNKGRHRKAEVSLEMKPRTRTKMPINYSDTFDDEEETSYKLFTEEIQERLFIHGFTVQQVKEADAHPDDVASYSVYYADRAHIRHSELANKYSADEVKCAAYCVECGDAYGEYLDTRLIQDYKDCCDKFEGNSYTLGSFKSLRCLPANPRVICPLCGLAFAIKADGKIRDHAGCN